jgi:RIO-like serine/threonine protein kinase
MMERNVLVDFKLDDGYRLTYLGYDFLALSAFFKRGTVV